MRHLFFLCVVILSSGAALSQEGRPGFKEQVIDPGAGVGKPWTPIKIDEAPTMRRRRVIDANGNGKKELVCSPLHGRDATGPEWWKGNGAALYILRRPAGAFKEPWKREVIGTKERGDDQGRRAPDN